MEVGLVLFELRGESSLVGAVQHKVYWKLLDATGATVFRSKARPVERWAVASVRHGVFCERRQGRTQLQLVETKSDAILIAIDVDLWELEKLRYARASLNRGLGQREFKVRLGVRILRLPGVNSDSSCLGELMKPRRMSIFAKDLPKTDVFGSSDPYVVIQRRQQMSCEPPSEHAYQREKRVELGRSRPVRNEHSPNWGVVVIPSVLALCLGIGGLEVDFVVVDRNYFPKPRDEFVGRAYVSASALLSGDPIQLPLRDRTGGDSQPKLAKSRLYVQCLDPLPAEIWDAVGNPVDPSASYGNATPYVPDLLSQISAEGSSAGQAMEWGVAAKASMGAAAASQQQFQEDDSGWGVAPKDFLAPESTGELYTTLPTASPLGINQFGQSFEPY